MTQRYMERMGKDVEELVDYIQTKMRLFEDNDEGAARFAIQILIYDKLSQLVSDRGVKDDRANG